LFSYSVVFSELQNQLLALDKEFQDIIAQKKNIENKMHDLEEEKFDMDNDVEKQKSHLNEKDREMEVLQKDFEYAKDREAVLMGDRYVSLNSI
jgi:septation ring formation regulator EzrA